MSDLKAAWQRYSSVFDEAADAIRATSRFDRNPDLERRLYRVLMQVQAMAYNFAIVPRAERPRPFVHTTYMPDFYTVGMACPDFHYTGLFLDGSRRYRLTGRRGDVLWMSAQVQSHLLGDPASRVIGDFDFADFETGQDGSFEVIASGRPETGDHIRLDPESPYNFIWLRRIVGDWMDDIGELEIELLDETPADHHESQAAFLLRIQRAEHLARYLLLNWSVGLYRWYDQLTGGFNKIAFLDGQRLSDRDVGSLAAYYAVARFQIEPDEALLVEGVVPQGVYWGFQLGDTLSTSLDFLHHQTDLNFSRIHINDDGKFRVVLAMEDPGIANWLDTNGDREGVMIMRTFRSVARPELPELRVVKIADLGAELPSDTCRTSKAQRCEDLKYRQRAIRHLYGQ